MNKKYTIDDLRQVMKKLLSENGCPWDKAQTHDSLKQYFIEETYEVIEAINNRDKNNLCEELGDVLFQIVFHSELAEKENLFLFEDVVDGITRKMILRHPHVFTDDKNTSPEKISLKWESIKKAEKDIKVIWKLLKVFQSPCLHLCEVSKQFQRQKKQVLNTLILKNWSAKMQICHQNLKQQKIWIMWKNWNILVNFY